MSVCPVRNVQQADTEHGDYDVRIHNWLIATIHYQNNNTYNIEFFGMQNILISGSYATLDNAIKALVTFVKHMLTSMCNFDFEFSLKVKKYNGDSHESSCI
jgi:hypothetical protein